MKQELLRPVSTKCNDDLPLFQSKRCKNFVRVLLIFVLGLFSITGIKAQYNATWALSTSTTNTGALTGTAPIHVTIGNMVPGTVVTGGAYNSDGYKSSISSGSWPTVPTDGYNLDFPISPTSGFDLSVTGVTFTAKTSGGSGNNIVSLAYQQDGAGPWVAFGTPQPATSGGTTNISFGTLSQLVAGGHTYVIRVYIYAVSGVTSSRSIYIKNVVISGNTPASGTPPTVATNTATATGKYTATATGTVTSGTSAVTVSGVCWSTSPLPTVALPTVTTNGPAGSGSITSNITGLSAGVTYHVRAYASSFAGTSYGADLTFTTNPPSTPTLTTTQATYILSTKATSGGTITDSGGVSLLAEGVCWNTTGTPTITDSKTSDGTLVGTYSSFIKGLTPSTTYHVRAYATNSIGTNYGNEITFTTLAPVPTITASVPSLDFGNVVINTTSAAKTYTLTATTLSPASGNITVKAPAGFLVSSSAVSGFASSINVPYTGSALPATTIYVQFAPTLYGAYGDIILHSGGTAVNPNIDTVRVTGVGIQSPQALTNSGTDFWTGFAYENSMQKGAGDQDSVSLALYIAAGAQAATVVVDLPALTATQKAAFNFPRTVTVPANGVATVTYFPAGDPNDGTNAAGLPDSRLYYTGISNRAIHISSTNGVPVSAWMHTYTHDNSAAGSMLFPTNTWNSSYTVQAYGGQSNENYPNSFFFVIANQDNTPVTFVPINDVIDSSSASIFKEGSTSANVLYHAGQSYTVTLNKGQVFNAMGYIQGSGKNNANGLDLSGTTVSTTCDKKIAVFGGNGRVLDPTNGCVPSTGSDNLVQQMFPKVAWGTRYLTVPTKDMEYNLFRIYVSDVTTVVKVNGTTITGLINNLYYQIEGNQPNLITSDKPINVTQFIIAGTCKDATVGNSAAGDPEMIILSPVQQAISSATVYSAFFKNGNAGGSYINVVIPKAGVASFAIDGLSGTALVDTGAASTGTAFASSAPVSVVNAFQPHPGDPNYYFAKFKVAYPASHTLSSTASFNAIAYGMNGGESYGYNAGTAINNLGQSSASLQNPYGSILNSSAGGMVTCTGIPFNFSAVLPFQPTSITWNFDINGSSNANLSPNAPVTVTSPVADSSYSSNGQTYYVYKLKSTSYKFSQPGNYPVTVTTVNPSLVDPCTTGSQTFSYSVQVVANVTPNFTVAFSSCAGDSAKFTDASNGNGQVITKWQWDFNNGKIDSVQNPGTVYTVAGTYNVKLRTINNIGCYADTIKPVKVVPVLTNPVVVADSISFDYIRFKWAPVAGATSYLVSIDGGTTFTPPSSGPTGTTHVVSGLQANDKINIIVKAIGDSACQVSTGTGTGTTVYSNVGVFVPNTFTPNGDSKNDVLKVFGNNLKSINLRIFNQWGQLIYQTTDLNGGWDGTYKGQQQPVGVYIYVLEVTEQNGNTSIKKGSVNLIR